MRYYNIQVLNSDGSPYMLASGAAQWTSVVNGQFDVGALQVDLDLPVVAADSPISAADVKIWGVDLKTRGQASDFNGKLINIYGGMFKGLPLATAAYNAGQSGLLLSGLIWQAFGNSIGVNQWLEFIVTTNATTTVGQQLNIPFNWPKGQPLATAITNTLATAVPAIKPVISISSNIVLSENEAGIFENIFQFATYLRRMSMSVIKTPGYQGVSVVVTPKGILVQDGSSPTAPKDIVFTDLVGQPTWIGPGEIQVTTIMRAGIQVGDYIKLPTTQITAAPTDNLIPLGDKSIFQGSFGIKSLRHIGSSRQPDALAWISVINAYPEVAPTS